MLVKHCLRIRTLGHGNLKKSWNYHHLNSKVMKLSSKVMELSPKVMETVRIERIHAILFLRLD